MIKVLVISDTHGNTSLIRDVVNTHQDYDFFLHLGDSEVDPFYISPFVSVKGNCDYGSDYPPSREIHTRYGIIHMEHGNYRHDKEYILEKNAFIFLFGHTHQRYEMKFDDNHYAFNPGSLSRPRDNDRGTYLELLIDENGVRAVFREI